MKVLFVTSRFPYPLEKGDKLRAYHFIKCLSQKHEVHLFAINEGEVNEQSKAELTPYCKTITVVNLSFFQKVINLLAAVFNGLPFQVGYFSFSNAERELQKLVDAQQPDVVFCHLIRTAELAKGLTNIPKVIDYMDTFSVGIKRRIESEGIFSRWLWQWEYQKLLRYEAAVYNRFKLHTIISKQDRSFLPVEQPEKVVVLPNGVELPPFQEVDLSNRKYDIIFAGNMNYPPNIEAVHYLVKKVMPLVWQQLPQVNVVIAGAEPAVTVRGLASAKVEVTGWVQSIKQYFDRSRILVAPMLISIGLQNKLLEAMAAGVPCVTSVLANNALQAEPGKEVLVAEKPEEYAAHIVNLLKNQALYHSISNEGYRFASAEYSWQKVSLQLNDIINKAGNE